MIYDLDKMMISIVDNWDSSIFRYGGDTSLAGYTEEQYKLLGYADKRDFATDDFFKEFSFDNTIKGTDNDIGIGQMLNNDDKDLLVEHGQSLFDNVKDEAEIYRYMLGLALHFNRYRYLKTRDVSINKIYQIGKSEFKKHYSRKEKEKKLKECAEEMMQLMGGVTTSYGIFTDGLKLIIEKPELYIPINKYKISKPKQSIKDYLVRLGLKKTIAIQNFIKEIA